MVCSPSMVVLRPPLVVLLVPPSMVDTDDGYHMLDALEVEGIVLWYFEFSSKYVAVRIVWLPLNIGRQVQYSVPSW